MTQLIQKLFLDHPSAVNENYREHAVFAFGVSMKLFVAAFAALVHAVIPALCDKTASRIVAALYERTHNRGN